MSKVAPEYPPPPPPRTAVWSNSGGHSLALDLRLASGLMAQGHEHDGGVETEKVNSTLEEWVAQGWELVTAYCGPSSTVTHYLYFRREVGGHYG